MHDKKTDFAIGSCLFRAVQITKNIDPDNIDVVVTVLDLMLAHIFIG